MSGVFYDDEMTADPELPGSVRTEGSASVTLTRRAADRLREGHLWVYRSELQALRAPEAHASGPDRGALVTLMDGRGMALGTALYSSASQIALRMVSHKPALDRAAYLAELRDRVAAALALRRELAPVSAINDARRLIFAEADGLPGIVADQYGAVGVVQLLVQGTARDDVRTVLGEALAEAFPGGAGTIWERTDSRIRQMEGLEAGPEGPIWAVGVAQSESIFTVNGLRFHYDAGAGQKTGAFLDQRLNYGVAAGYGRGRALDVCTYQGGFALHLGRVCDRVTGVDASRAALEVADRNLLLNRESVTAAVDWIEADAFELMRAYDEAGERFDTVVLDPPAFAKSSPGGGGGSAGV